MKKIVLIIIILLSYSICIKAQWIHQYSGTQENLYDVKFLNRYTGWTVGDGGIILKTINGGDNWINIVNPAISKPLSGISIVDSNVVYITGWFETIIKTIDGGSNWIIIRNGPSGQGSSYDAIFFINANTGWIAGPDQMVWKTTDGGTTLTGGYLSGTFHDLFFKDENTGLVTGSAMSSYKTTNGGNNWYHMIIPFGIVISEFYKISVVNNQFCWLAGNDRRIFRSTNFGDTWDTISGIPSPSNDYIYCSAFTNTLTGWIGGENNRLYKTTNGGFNWKQENTGTGLWFWGALYCFSDSIVWGVGGMGKIINTTTGGQPLIGISNNEKLFNPDFELYQNYPNPFNPVTKIEYNIPKDGNVKIVIYDLLGKEIFTLINERKRKGNHSLVFNAEVINKINLSGGVYLYSLFFNNNLINTKKMIFIK
jgi:photosystem II stability/assembly factor-like uncharacterized protein